MFQELIEGEDTLMSQTFFVIYILGCFFLYYEVLDKGWRLTRVSRVLLKNMSVNVVTPARKKFLTSCRVLFTQFGPFGYLDREMYILVGVELNNYFINSFLINFSGGFVRCYEHELEKDTDWKTVILEGKSNNAIMSAGTVSECPEGKKVPEPEDPDNPGPENVSSEGIVLGHEYSLLDIQEVRDITDSSKIHTLLKLRNPWGNATEWNGAFCDSDAIWNNVTPNLRANPDQVRPDGEFWIPLENWMVYLDDLDICVWSAKYRGDSSVIDDGFILFQTSANFPDTNHGDVKSAEDFEGKPGYYIHLRPKDPDSGKTGKNGLKNNCHLVINLMYENYTKSGDNPHIPSMGFHLLWAPGEQSPKEKESFKKVIINEKHMNPKGGARDVNICVHLPAGTAFVIPWIQEPADEPTPYLLRIGTEGELHEYSP